MLPDPHNGGGITVMQLWQWPQLVGRFRIRREIACELLTRFRMYPMTDGSHQLIRRGTRQLHQHPRPFPPSRDHTAFLEHREMPSENVVTQTTE